MAFSQYLADSLLLWLKGDNFPTPLTTLHLSVHTGNPGTAGTGADVTTAVCGGRVGVSASLFTTPATSQLSGGGRQISNTQAVSLTANASSAATLTHFGIWDAASGGNFLGYGVLSSERAVQIGDVLQFPVGQLIIRNL